MRYSLPTAPAFDGTAVCAQTVDSEAVLEAQILRPPQLNALHTHTTPKIQNDEDLDALPTRPLILKNPHHASAAPMQLFVLEEVIARCREKHAAKEAAKRYRQEHAAERAAAAAKEGKRRRAAAAEAAKRAVGTAADGECRLFLSPCMKNPLRALLAIHQHNPPLPLHPCWHP